tara:strand:+ start:932 stop:2014 length:1083 start_codon:yes stop_codon:yes gene_type:complete
MHGAEGISFKFSKYRYLRALALLVTTIFSTVAYSDFAVFTTSERNSLESRSGTYFESQLRDLLNIPRSERISVYDPLPIDFEDILSDLSRTSSGKSSHIVYLSLPASYSENELKFSFDGESLSLREIYSMIEGLEGDYLLIIESEEGYPSQLKWPNMPNNISVIGAEISTRLQESTDLPYAPPYSSDLSILFFQQLSSTEAGQEVSVETITSSLYREFDDINLYFFYGGTGSNAKLPTFIPESGSYYSAVNIEAKEEALKEKEAQLAREAEARKEKEAQLTREAEALKEKESQLAREAEARKEKEAQLNREAETKEKEELGEALALIEKMKAEAAERERQLKEANEEAEKKRKNTTSFGF